MVDTIITMHNVSYRYPSGLLALNAIDLDIPKGKRIALLGANGAGKSTLMYLLNGILRPTEGFLTLENDRYSYKRKALRYLRSKVGLLFQDSDNQLLAPTVYEEISFGLINLVKDKNWVRCKVDEIIGAFGLHEISDRSPYELSAGQKKRVCLASVLAMEPELLVCDEPCSNLDPVSTQLTIDYLNDLNSLGKTVLVATHDVNMAYVWADHVIILKSGNVMCSGTPKEVFGNRRHIEDAGLHLPYMVNTAQTFIPNIKHCDLPLNNKELHQLLNGSLCKGS